MDLSASKKFDAFQGNPLQKSSMGSSKKSGSRMSIKNGGSFKEQLFDLDQMWRGSISNLKSSENITEDLIQESIKELERAMSESKRMLIDRDNEIARLRQYIENNKLVGGRSPEDDNDEADEKRHTELVKALKQTQKENATLERQMHELKLEHSKEISSLKNENKAPPIWHLEEPDLKRPECTCYCGTVCKALKDLVDTRQTLENTKIKYENLKRRVKEFRRQAEIEQQNTALRNMAKDEDRMSNCSIM